MHTSNWMIKLSQELQKNGIPVAPGGAFLTKVLHDDWCDRLNGRGPCNCDPDLRVLDHPPRTSLDV